MDNSDHETDYETAPPESDVEQQHALDSITDFVINDKPTALYVGEDAPPPPRYLLKMGINDFPRFDGKKKEGRYEYPIKAFVARFDELAAMKGWTGINRCQVINSLLEGRPKLFLRDWIRTQDANRDNYDWPMLKAALLASEANGPMDNKRKQEMYLAKQGNHSLHDFLLRLDHYFDEIEVYEEMKKIILMNGIRDDLRRRLEISPKETYQETVKAAKLIDSVYPVRINLVGSGTTDLPRRDAERSRGTTRGRSTPGRFQAARPSLYCRNHGECGHTTKDCKGIGTVQRSDRPEVKKESPSTNYNSPNYQPYQSRGSF